MKTSGIKIGGELCRRNQKRSRCGEASVGVQKQHETPNLGNPRQIGGRQISYRSQGSLEKLVVIGNEESKLKDNDRG